MNQKSNRTLYLSHGAGPMPLLNHPSQNELVENLKELAEDIDKPSAIIIMSAHWETKITHITCNVNPNLLYDYSGFPEDAYQIAYPAMGQHKLSLEIEEILNGQDIPCQLDSNRDFDHGVFVPLKLMYSDADIPIVQISMDNSLSAEKQMELGKALRLLSPQNILIIGSGSSFHNLSGFFNPTPEHFKHNLHF
jgi:4,5-DOPA dioxygenase extradiol